MHKNEMSRDPVSTHNFLNMRYLVSRVQYVDILTAMLNLSMNPIKSKFSYHCERPYIKYRQSPNI